MTKTIFWISILLAILSIDGFVKEASAEQIRIEFEGEFADCFSSNCGSLSNLNGTSFFGVIEFPADTTIADAEVLDIDSPFDGQRGNYTFASPSFLSFTTQDPNFSVSETPVQLAVFNCIGITCAPVDDFILIVVFANGFEYSLLLSAPLVPFDSVAIPNSEVLQTMRGASASISNEDLSAFISSDEFSPFDFSVTLNPVNNEADDDLLLMLPPILATLKKNEGPEEEHD